MCFMSSDIASSNTESISEMNPDPCAVFCVGDLIYVYETVSDILLKWKSHYMIYCIVQWW